MKHIIVIFLISIIFIGFTSANASVLQPILQPSLQAQMIKQEKINKRNMFTERRAQRLIEKQLLLNSNNKGTTTRMPLSQTKFILIGNNESERQLYLLSKYATPDFQDLKIWKSTALVNKIDPSFMMCVGLAESTLGQHLKTQYNIGNVGNTDSGGTYTFTSAEEGINWMAKTFNNRYLKKYTKVSELSRWGNPDGIIYASSPYNWHNNTIRCLRALKGSQAFDDYEFRIP
ncbi:hypothetical protein K2X92_05040 [Candidatus Gracilibacteria bacterium]|nr:hypothetical protein [Candidatus Gracilibacteria bacterium]